MKTKLTLLVSAALLILASGRTVNAQTPTSLSPNSYDGATTSPTGPSTFTTLPGGGSSVVFSQINRGSGLAATAVGNGYGSQSFNTATTAAAAVAATDFLTFTVTAGPLTTLTLSNYNFVFQRSGTGPNTVQLQVALQSTGNVFTNISGGQPLGVSTAAQAVNIIGVPTVIVPGDIATFRIVPFGATALGGTFRVVNGTSFTGIYTNLAPLPVTLTSFAAQAVAPRHTRLDWATAQESGNTRFDLERSTDGEHFTTLGTVNANSPTGGAYHFDDRTAMGDAAYRVRMVEADGSSQVSKTLWVRGTAATADVRVNTIVRDALHIQSNGSFSYTVLDQQGRVVRQASAPGTGVTDVAMSDLANGTYVLHLSINGAGQRAYQIIKQ